MEGIWQSAPAPALHAWYDAAGLQVRPNDAAARWAQQQGLAEADWLALVAGCMASEGPGDGDLAVGSGRWLVACRRVVLADGSMLFWLDPGTETLAQRTRLVAEAIGVGFWSRDLDAGSAYWDEQMYRIHRRRPEQGPPEYGQWIAGHVHPQDRAWLSELYRRANDSWEPVVDATFRVPDEDGGERWVQTWTRRAVRDGRRVAFGMHLDVTDRERVRELLERERERMRFALEAAELGVWERQLDGRIAYWSEAMYRLRGLDPADPRTADEIAESTTHPEDHALLAQAVRRHVEDGLPYQFEFRIQRPDGAWRWLATRGRALRDTDGRVLGMAGINLDITERKQAEALRLEKARAEQASRDKSAFMARLSHELRTPMNAVLGFTQLMTGDADEPPSARQQGRLRRIAEAGAQMMTLVDELLDLARRDDTLPPSPGSVPSMADMLPPLTVLCVEDNPVNLLLVRELLAKRPQVKLHEAVDGASAIVAAQQFGPDVLLVDLQLPDMSGIDVLLRLRDLPALAGSVFVALSANAMPEQITSARAAGFHEYWTKPIDLGKFLAGIDRLARDQGASRSRSQPPPSAAR